MRKLSMLKVMTREDKQLLLKRVTEYRLVGTLTLRQRWNRTRAWFRHTFIHRGYDCTDFSRICPGCKEEFEVWRKERFLEQSQSELTE